MNQIPDSFTAGQTETAPSGQKAHPAMIQQNKRLEEQLYKVGEKAWTYVGNGLSNQSFVEGPTGLIVIDTGECVEEMELALSAIRQETQAPIVACIYTHFHYVAGTTAVLKESGNENLPIYGHDGIEANLLRFGGEVGPRSARGLVHQFAVVLPEDGPDGIVNVGLGRFLRNPRHAPFTHGHVPANHTINETTEFSIAGLKVKLIPAPSDATDSITIWFSELKLAANNLLWPALFNVFAIRGEEYRDPRILLKGLDGLEALGADYLMGTHGPPIEGSTQVQDSIINYRDSIQYMWDQTVRGANLGLTLDELTSFVQLPSQFKDSYLTTQLYGVVEHHVRQIYNGLFGWFDEDESKLFPTPSPERAQKLIAGFGGKPDVRLTIDKAIEEGDYRWAIELSTWLVRCEFNSYSRADAGEQEDRDRLALSLRGVAQSTTSANIRNWCLTRALELEGTLNLERFRGHRFRVAEVMNRPAAQSVSILKVLLVPEKAADFDQEIRIIFDDGTTAGLRIRNQVAVPTDGNNAEITLTISHQQWAQLLGGKSNLVQLLSEDELEATPGNEEIIRFFRCFDLESLNS
jgi:alkyl sulfatase BDS1-like metallo-beta-lactamase superfamily hydrolase